MDSGAVLRRSRRLAGLPPSASPPPLGERNRQSRRTTSHIDSHIMGYREDAIPEMSSPPQEVGEEDPTPVYDPSPEIPSQYGYDPSFIGHQYWLPGNETHYEPTSTSHVHYGMSDIPTPDLAHRRKLNLALLLGALLFLSMRIYLGVLVTLHLPSL